MSFFSIPLTFLAALSGLLAVAFYTLLERQVLGAKQLRKGPRKVSIIGVLQPIADAIKLFSKATTIPLLATNGFQAGPFLALALASSTWILLPYPASFFSSDFSALIYFTLAGMFVYPVLLCGWASGSRFALLGSFRGVAQTISYEVVFGILLLCYLMPASSFCLSTLHSTLPSTLALFCPLSLAWLIVLLAEASRTPFDHNEGESELVSGFNIEYSGAGFALLFLAEYLSLLTLSMVSALLMLPSPFFLFYMLAALTLSLFPLLARGALPRLRFDSLMLLCWCSLLPFSLFTFLLFYLGSSYF